jgi:hypothetical protein
MPVIDDSSIDVFRVCSGHDAASEAIYRECELLTNANKIGGDAPLPLNRP